MLACCRASYYSLGQEVEMAKAAKKNSSTGSGKSAKSVVSALPAKRQKGTLGPMNQQLVNRYSAELSKALGTTTFNDIFERLKADPDLKQDEAIAVGLTNIGSACRREHRARHCSWAHH
jgi:hypothetical protein